MNYPIKCSQNFVLRLRPRLQAKYDSQRNILVFNPRNLTRKINWISRRFWRRWFPLPLFLHKNLQCTATQYTLQQGDKPSFWIPHTKFIIHTHGILLYTFDRFTRLRTSYAHTPNSFSLNTWYVSLYLIDKQENKFYFLNSFFPRSL